MTIRRSTLLRRTAPALLLAAVLLPGDAVADATGGTVDKTGWWYVQNAPLDSPAGPVTVPTLPPGILPVDDPDLSPALGVPEEGALPVGAGASGATYVSGIGFQPTAGQGARVVEFTLTVAEDPDAPAQVGAELAQVVACPITEFWIGGPDGEWAQRPAADCELAQAAGVRDETGTWTFDLAPIGAVWFDGTVRPDGVLLVPALDDGAAFQVAFAEETVDVVLVAEGGEATDPFATPDVAAPATPSAPPSASGSGSGPAFSTGVILSPPTLPDAAGDASPSTPTTPASPDPEQAAPSIEPVASRDERGNLANLPPALLLLVLLAVATLGSLSWWLGPAGEPDDDRASQRGVSRALDAASRRDA